MSKLKSSLLCLSLFLASCASPNPENFDVSDSARLSAAANIVDAVNAKDAQQYARDLHPDVVVKLYDGDVRLRGREAVIANRSRHFETHPEARNALIHLVEIDNRVVMHDKVWLSGDTSTEPADIVEVFTFEYDKIIQIDVIQPADLFRRNETN